MATLDDTLGDVYLDRFDEIDLDQGKENRRVALFCMENFYAEVMSSIGSVALDCEQEIYHDNLAERCDRFIARLEDIASESGDEDLWRYCSMIKEELKTDRGGTYHNFKKGVGKDKLEKYREKAPEIREYFLQMGEKYQEKHGAYSKKEYTNIVKNVQSAEGTLAYRWGCEMLYQEFEYIERVLLKQDGRSTEFIRDTGTHAYHAGFIDDAQLRKIRQVVTVDRGNYEDLRDDKAINIIKDGLEVLGYLYRSLSPYHEESLLTTKFVAAVEDSGFEITRVKEREREVWVSYNVRFDDIVVEDAGVILQPEPDGVAVLAPYFPEKELNQMDTNELNHIREYIRRRDELENGEGVLLTWNRGINVEDNEIQKKFEGHWPPKDP